MTTYRNIHGRSIQAVTTDPTGDVTEGQIWYNTDSDTFKTVLLNQAWSSSSPMITARRAMNNGFGAQNSGVAVGGYSTTYHNNTEEYNGTGWASSGNYPASLYYIQTSGTETAGLAVGGGDPVVTTVNEYNGSSWTSANGLPTATKGMQRAGTQTASIYGGGFQPSTVGTCYLYDGTNWTSAPALNTARGSGAGSGAQTDAVFYGGGGTGTNAQTEEFNGSSWSEQNDLPTAKQNLGFANDTTSTSAIGSGGYTPPNTRTTTCFKYDGTSWSTIPSLSTAKAQGASGAGTADGAYFAGGTQTGTAVNTTEEYNSSANVVTAAAWATIANFPDSRAYSGGSGGTPTSTLVFGGYTGPGLGGFVSSGAEFDGSSWTAAGSYSIDVVGVAGLGPVTAGLGTGGYRDTATNVNSSYEYDGSSWTTGNNSNAAGQGAKMAGTQTAASMGNRSGDGDGHEQYDGTNWTTATNTPVSGNAGAMMAGTQTALLMYGGENSPKVRTEEWNGSSWTSGNNMNLDRRQGSHGGTQTYAIAGGGDSNPGIFGNTELWDGTSWASSVSMGTARFYQVGGFTTGSSGVTSNIAATGRTPGSTHSNNCEEFSSETIALNVKTLTQS